MGHELSWACRVGRSARLFRGLVSGRVLFGRVDGFRRVRAGRAAGNALSHCPIELFVPCHRVVLAGGTIGGYGRHEDRKRWLLRHESAIA